MFEDYQFEWDPQKDEANLKKHSSAASPKGERLALRF